MFVYYMAGIREYCVSCTMKKTSTIFHILIIILTISSCANNEKEITRIPCNIKPVPGRAVLCSRTVFMSFGPADQFIGYTVIRGQVLAILERELAESVFSIDIEKKRTFLKNIDELAANQSVMSYTSGSKGEIALTVDPGFYILCTQSQQGSSTFQPILRCEPANFNEDQKYKLLFIDNPRTGIQFEWK